MPHRSARRRPRAARASCRRRSGHQVVGDVVAVGSACTRLAAGDRVGIAWLRKTCGSCAWCRTGRENLCPNSRYTGWDEDGGFAEYAVVPEAFAYLLPPDADPVATAPLLCAGIIGYRALARTNLPPGARWASTASARAPTSRRSSRSRAGRPSTR
ncbi:MAG: alcohol dehydrogenase catalytic domain-containing protein [Galbitalea sp.]